MNYHDCKDCIYLSKYYGNKDSKGNPQVSKHWCVNRQSFLKKFPKHCKDKETEGYFSRGYEE